jgi:hypothetical protein
MSPQRLGNRRGSAWPVDLATMTDGVNDEEPFRAQNLVEDSVIADRSL